MESVKQLSGFSQDSWEGGDKPTSWLRLMYVCHESERSQRDMLID